MDDLSDTIEYLDISCDDLNLYFSGTHILTTFAENKFPRQWCFVDGFLRHARGEITVRLYPAKMDGVFKVPLQELDFDFHFPNIGLYNHKQSVVYLSRRSLRQNKKALCPENVAFFSIFELFRKFSSLPEKFMLQNSWRWTTKGLHNVFSESKFFSLEEAFTKVCKLKSFARAINNNFFVGPGVDTIYPSLWYRKTLIGGVPTKASISIRNQSFLQEAQDFFAPQGVEINVDA